MMKGVKQLQYEFHEVANIFPMMSETEFAGLVEDMRKNGQIEPIWAHQQKIIDGRNRYNACLEIGVDPIVNEWDGKGSLVDFAVSKNFHRRQLNAGQRAMVGDKIKVIFEDDAKARQAHGQTAPGRTLPLNSREAEKGESTGKAAKLVNSSKSSVESAGRVRKYGIPEVAEAVEQGKVSLYKADTISKLPKDQQPEILKKAIANEPIKPKPTPEPIQELGYMEGAESLHEILQNINSTLGLLVGHAETELLSLPKSTVKNAKHASQGSEWDNVVLYDDSCPDKNDPTQQARWRYTGVTRAAKKLIWMR